MPVPCAIRTKSLIFGMLCNTQVIPVFLEPKTCINYFQEENYAFNIKEL